MQSPDELYAELDDPAVPGSGDAPEAAGGDRRVRVVEIRLIEGVEELPAKLQPEAVRPEVEVPQKGEVRVHEARPRDEPPDRVAVDAAGDAVHGDERRGVEERRDHVVAAGVLAPDV